MADPTTIDAPTNCTRNSSVIVQCNCATMWSLVQQLSNMRLTVPTGKLEGRLVKDYAVRARRIAATYARFYLELEDGCDPDRKGRFYWMALGAFASKTVACTFEQWQIHMLSSVSNTVRDALGKGNFWLFCDISGWHWYYCKFRSSFDQCMNARNTNTYVRPVKLQMESLPWKDKALPAIRHLAVSEEIKIGFAKVKEFEIESDRTAKRTIQLEHLLAIARHEQGVVLQPLIYDDPEFSSWIQHQRSWYINWASPPLQLVFTHACDTDDDKLKSVAPKGTELENLESRMQWIESVARKFHDSMQRRRKSMEEELHIIVSWVYIPDKG